MLQFLENIDAVLNISAAEGVVLQIEVVVMNEVLKEISGANHARWKSLHKWCEPNLGA